MIKKLIKVPIFDREIRFYYCEYNEITKIYGEDAFFYADGITAGVESPDGNFHHVVWINADDHHNIAETIAHEAVHVAYYILSDIGQEHDTDNHEILAYLVGYLVAQFDNAINKRKKK